MQETFAPDRSSGRAGPVFSPSREQPGLHLMRGPRRFSWSADAIPSSGGAQLDRALLLPAAHMALSSLRHEGFNEAAPLWSAVTILAENAGAQGGTEFARRLCRAEVALQRAAAARQERGKGPEEVEQALQRAADRLKESLTHALRHVLQPSTDRQEAAFHAWRSAAASIISAWRCFP